MSPFSLIALAWWTCVRAVVRLVSPPVARLAGPAEGPARASAAERRLLGALSRCVGCGACDARFGAYGAVDRLALRGPSDAVALARTGDVIALTRFVRALRRGDVEALERVCPARVPFVELAHLFDVASDASGTSAPGAPRHDPG